MRRVTEKDILKGRKAIQMLRDHIDIQYEREIDLFTGYCDIMMEQISKLGIRYQKQTTEKDRIMTKHYMIYLTKGFDNLSTSEMELLNDDDIVKFLVIFVDLYPISLLQCTERDDDLYYVSKQILEESPFSTIQTLLFREYKYPIAKIFVSKIMNYNCWEIVEKIKGMWV